ncbi:MAG TPA: hypothetical protein VIW67_04475 [Terriglobales bacterium]
MKRNWIAGSVLLGILWFAGCKQKVSNPPEQVSSTQPSTPAPAAQETTSANTPPTPQAQSRPSGPVQFIDVTEQAGIHFKHNTGAFGKKYLPETMGNGACFLDYDNDGWQDILIINSMDWREHKTGNSYSALYHNNHDGTFTDVT